MSLFGGGGGLNLPTLVQRLTLDSSGFVAGGAAAQGTMAKMSAGSAAAGKTLTKSLTLPIIGLGVAAVASAISVEDAQNKIIRTTGATGRAAEGLKESFKNVFANTAASGDEVATALAQLHQRTDLTGKSLEDLTLTVLTFNRTIGKDSPLDVRQLTSTLSLFNVPAKEMGNHLDRLNIVSQKTGVPLNDLLSTLQGAGPILKQFNLPIEQSAGLLAQLDKAGVSAQSVMPGLRKAFITFAKDGKEPAKALRELIGTMGDLIKAGDLAGARSLAVKMFGARGAGLVDAAVSGKLSLDSLTKSLDSSGKSIKQIAADTPTLAGKMKVLTHNVQLALAEFGAPILDAFIGVMKILLPIVSAVSQAFTHIPKPLKTVAIGALAVVAAVGPMLSIFGRLGRTTMLMVNAFRIVDGKAGLMVRAFSVIKTAASALWTVIAANPFIAIAVAVAILAVIVVKNWDTIKKAIGTAVDFIGDKLSFLSTFVDSLKKVFGSLDAKKIVLLIVAPFVELPVLIIEAITGVNIIDEIQTWLSDEFSNLNVKKVAAILIAPFVFIPNEIVKSITGFDILGEIQSWLSDQFDGIDVKKIALALVAPFVLIPNEIVKAITGVDVLGEVQSWLGDTFGRIDAKKVALLLVTPFIAIPNEIVKAITGEDIFGDITGWLGDQFDSVDVVGAAKGLVKSAVGIPLGIVDAVTGGDLKGKVLGGIGDAFNGAKDIVTGAFTDTSSEATKQIASLRTNLDARLKQLDDVWSNTSLSPAGKAAITAQVLAAQVAYTKAIGASEDPIVQQVTHLQSLLVNPNLSPEARAAIVTQIDGLSQEYHDALATAEKKVVDQHKDLLGKVAGRISDGAGAAGDTVSKAFDSVFGGLSFDVDLTSFDSISDTFQRGLDRIGKAASGLPDAIGGLFDGFDPASLLPDLSGAFDGFDPVGTITGIIEDGLPRLGDALGDIGSTLLDAITSLPGEILPELAKLPGKIVKALLGIPTQILNDATTIRTEIANAVVSAVGGIADFVGGIDFGAIGSTIIDGIVSGFTTTVDIGGKIIEFIASIPGRIIDFFTSEGPGLVASAAGFVGNLAVGIATAIPGLIQSGIDLAGDLIGSIIDGIVGAIPRVVDTAKKLPGRIVKGIGDLIDDVKEAGSNLAHGLIDGFESGMGDLLDALDNFLGRIPSKILDFFGISSPSKLMADIAVNIPLGIAEGILNGIPGLIEQAAQLPVAILSGIGDLATAVFSQGVGVITGLISGAQSVIPQLLGEVAALPGRILGALGDLFAFLLPKGVAFVQGLLTGIVNTIGNVLGFVAGIPGQVLSAIGDTAGKLVEAGKNFIAGLINGIKNGAKNLFGTVADIGKKAVHYITHPWEVFSPSHVTQRLGVNIMDGLTLGLKKSKARTFDEITSTAKGLRTEIAKPVGTFTIPAPKVGAPVIPAPTVEAPKIEAPPKVDDLPPVAVPASLALRPITPADLPLAPPLVLTPLLAALPPLPPVVAPITPELPAIAPAAPQSVLVIPELAPIQPPPPIEIEATLIWPTELAPPVIATPTLTQGTDAVAPATAPAATATTAPVDQSTTTTIVIEELVVRSDADVRSIASQLDALSRKRDRATGTFNPTEAG